MKRYHYFIILFLILIGVSGGFYAGSHYSAGINQELEPVKQQDTAVSQGKENTSLFPPLSSSVEVASKSNLNINTVFGVDILIIDKTIQMLREEYLDEISYVKLINGAVSGIKKRLAQKNLDSSFVIPLKKMPEKEMIVELHKLYNKAMALYGNKISESDLAYGALIGMMESLHDPYSVALEPKEYKLLNEFMSGGNYGGIGIYLEVHKQTKMLTVVDTIIGGPAARAGLKSGDVVVKIDGASVKGMDLEVASQKVRGKKGTRITLLIDRASEGLREYSMIRDIIHENSVISSMKPGRIAYVKVGFFGENTGQEFGEELEKMYAEGAKGLIIDLRNNTGGYISGAIDVCSHLLESGSLVVSVVNPRTGRNEVYRAYGSKQSQIPIAVLVNENSASSSEIAAGALKDTGSAAVIGTKTYGKGVVQSIRELRDGGALKFTIAKYLTPRGIDINKKGITPDYIVEMPPQNVNTKTDVQRDRAIAVLKDKLNKKPEKKTETPAAAPKDIPEPVMIPEPAD